MTTLPFRNCGGDPDVCGLPPISTGCPACRAADEARWPTPLPREPAVEAIDPRAVVAAIRQDPDAFLPVFLDVMGPSIGEAITVALRGRRRRA